MSRSRLNLGDAGERYAERKLVNTGWRILERKWRGTAGEVDLIADDGDSLVLVEVKTRRGEFYGRAEEAVTPRKCARLIELGAEYVAQRDEYRDRYWRVDLVAVTLTADGRITRCTHIENACLDE